MRMPKHNRILSFLLVALVATALVLCVFAANGDGFAIRHNGTVVTSVTFSETERTELTLRSIPAGAELQWQLRLTDGETWVDISGQTGETLTLSYALVANILDQTGSTAVRCVAFADGQTYITEAVAVQMSFLAQNAVDGTMGYHSVMLMAEPDPQAELVTVTVNYVYSAEGGKEVWSPYTAQLAAGDSFHTTVSSPAAQGYKPDSIIGGINGVSLNVDDGSVTFALDQVDADITVTVIYQPVDVHYRVDYFLQNLNDDQYTLTQSGDYLGLADSYPDDGIRNMEFPGFSQLYYDPQTIAADGSTVFACYYDRNYYLINFELAGGFGVGPVYARYQDSLVVAVPERPGYVFAGWDLVSITDSEGNKIDHPAGGTYADGVKDTLIPSIGMFTNAQIVPGNYTYRALWTQSETSYTVAYWIRNGENRTYIGSDKVENVLSGTYANGKDNLASVDTSLYCGYPEHTHSAACYACENLGHTHEDSCYNCSLTAHTHGTKDCVISGCDHGNHRVSCFKDELTQNSPTQYDKAAFDALGKDLESGYIYTIVKDGTWPKLYLDEEWYEISADYIFGEVLASASANTDNGEYIVEKYHINMAKIVGSCGHTHALHCCSLTAHTHDVEDCFACGMVAHSHSQDCNLLLELVEFDEADQNVLIEGDGSSVVNVYYTYRMFTLRFYYAKKQWTETKYNGTDTTAVLLPEGYYYYVVGGSTYPFGGFYGGVSESTSVTELIARVGSDQWGMVKAIPTLKTERADYTLGSEIVGDASTYSDITYYYLEFTVPYNADLENLWPVDIFDPVPIHESEEHAQTTLTEAYFSAWNGEYRVKYTQDALSGAYGGNQTIKGLYMKLDENVVFDSQFASTADYSYDENDLNKKSCLVSFLGFWDNGANVSWSIPKQFNYHLMCAPAGTAYSNYELYKQFMVYDNSPLDTVSNQTAATIEGYTHVDTAYNIVSSGVSGVMDQVDYYFYYNPTPHYIRFWNHTGYLEDGRGSCWNYGASLTAIGIYLNDAYMADHYPSVLEPGAYVFEGWYTTPECLDGTKVDWNTYTMPDEDIVVYANWVPRTWNVKFYKLETAVGGADTYHTASVTHNEVMTNNQRPDNPIRDGYTFIGWFYYNERGEKMAFNISSMPVQQNMDLFAEWSSTTSTTYTVYYQLEGGTEIAEPTTGYLFAGATKTFSAKTGAQLYGDYQTGYYPDKSSASILMVEDAANNTAIFIYQQRPEVSYTVRHVDAATGTVLKTEEKGPVSSAIVTEFAEPLTVDGKTYLPQTFSQRLVLSANDEDNVITFYYVKADTTGAYVIRYRLQDLDGTDYAVQTDYIYGTAENGTTINASDYLKAFTGFTWNNQEATGTIATGGILELNLYYTRNSYAYTIRYVVKDTDALLKEDTGLTGMYGATVTKTLTDPEKTQTFAGIQYSLTDTMIAKSITIGTNEAENVISFYYEPTKTALNITNTGVDANDTVLYKVMGPMELEGTGNCIELIVAVKGSNSATIGDVDGTVGLYAGTYQVTPLTDWSYRYDLSDVTNGTKVVDSPAYSILLTEQKTYTMTYNYTNVGSDWLGGEVYCENVMEKSSSTGDN